MSALDSRSDALKDATIAEWACPRCDPYSVGTPGEWARKQRTERRQEFVRRNRRVLLIFGAYMTALVVAAVLFLEKTGPPSFAWFTAGAVAASAIWIVREIMDSWSGASLMTAGADAETATAEELTAIKNHRLVHGLYLAGFDIDHTVVGPSGVKAVETKWTSRSINPTLSHEQRLDNYLHQARRGAHQIKIFLKHAANLHLEVDPVLVIWGPEIASIPGGRREIDGVLVLVGRQASEWRRHGFDEEVLDEWQVAAVVGALEHQLRRQVSIRE